MGRVNFQIDTVWTDMEVWLRASLWGITLVMCIGKTCPQWAPPFPGWDPGPPKWLSSIVWSELFPDCGFGVSSSFGFCRLDLLVSMKGELSQTLYLILLCQGTLSEQQRRRGQKSDICLLGVPGTGEFVPYSLRNHVNLQRPRQQEFSQGHCGDILFVI